LHQALMQRSSFMILYDIENAIDSVLTRFRTAFDVAYSRRIERAVRYDSRAPRDARPDSDYDVAVFLNDFDLGQEARRIAEIETDILHETGAVINAIPFKAGFHQEHMGLMGEPRPGGFDL